MALTQNQLVTAVADRAELSKSDVKRALAALEDVVREEIGNAQKVRIGGLVQLTVRVKPAQKARKGRNPATGEEITIAAKPAGVDLRARPLAKAKEHCLQYRRLDADWLRKERQPGVRFQRGRFSYAGPRSPRRASRLRASLHRRHDRLAAGVDDVARVDQR